MLLLIGAGSVAAQGGGALTALNSLERGQWQLQPPGGGAPERLCFTGHTSMIQIRHRGIACNQVPMENTSQRAVVRYSCPGHGHGRTTITVETPRLVRIETQGIVDGAPFADEYEGRRMGSCS